MDKVKVSAEIAACLDKLKSDVWSKQFNLIAHCKNFSRNGICMRSDYSEEFKSLNSLQPLDFARCLIVGYEIKEK
ncbi:MAG: hypothetical protein ACQEXX_01230 [Bacillota bacterium]